MNSEICLEYNEFNVLLPVWTVIRRRPLDVVAFNPAPDPSSRLPKRPI
jgi:hypothetical protein